MKKIPTKINKKRFKQIEKIDRYKKINREDGSKNNISYEGLFVQDIHKKIDNIIVNEVQGIKEITLNVIKKIVDDQDNIRTITSSNINANVKLQKVLPSQINSMRFLQ